MRQKQMNAILNQRWSEINQDDVIEITNYEEFEKMIAPYEEKVKEMVNEAVSVYQKKHKGQKPGDSDVSQYEANVKLQIGVAIRAHKEMRNLKDEIDRLQKAKLSGMATSQDKTELIAKRKKLQKNRQRYKSAVESLLGGLHCLELSCECHTFRFPMEHIKINFEKESEVQ